MTVRRDLGHGATELELEAFCLALSYAWRVRGSQFDFDEWSALCEELGVAGEVGALPTTRDLEAMIHRIKCARGEHFFGMNGCTRCGWVRR